MSENKSLVVSVGRQTNLEAVQIAQAIAPMAAMYGLSQPQAAIAMLTGHELGFGMVSSLNFIYVIKSKAGLRPCISAQGMNALIQRAQVLKEFVVSDQRDPQGVPTGCTVKMTRHDGFGYEYTFTSEDAQRAELNNKANYKHHPGDMYRARAIAACARVVCPDVLAGLYLADELGAVTDAQGVPTGEIIDVTPQVLPAQPPPAPTTKVWTLSALIEQFSAQRVMSVNGGDIPATNEDCERIAIVLGLIDQFGQEAVEQANNGKIPDTLTEANNAAHNLEAGIE